ncbi:hypothetical protein AB3N59_11715 [Leptospira sp. WS92.C1]
MKWIQIKSFLLIFFSAIAIFAQSFKNGTHLINRDNRAYTIVYLENRLPSSKICFVKKPNKTIKNGLVPLFLRENVPGFKILSQKENTRTFEVETKAVIEAKTSIPCLSLNLISISLENGISFQGSKKQTIVIQNGKFILSSE